MAALVAVAVAVGWPVTRTVGLPAARVATDPAAQAVAQRTPWVLPVVAVVAVRTRPGKAAPADPVAGQLRTLTVLVGGVGVLLVGVLVCLGIVVRRLPASVISLIS